MSTPQAISAVTTVLQALIRTGVNRQRAAFGLSDQAVDVTTQPPHRIQPSAGATVNLYLYRVAPNPAFRNLAPPTNGKAGGGPLLPLNLSYLITVAGTVPGATEHELLGWVMSTLHDFPVLQRADFLAKEIQQVVASGVLDQSEQVKLTLAPLSAEELTKLWSGFQTNFRLSVGYDATVVLIESGRPAAAALPVLTRGLEPPEGFEVEPKLADPVLTGAAFAFPPPTDPTDDSPPRRMLTNGRANDTLRLDGRNLGGPNATVRLVFRHRRLSDPRRFEVAANKRSPTRILFTPFDLPGPWPIGFYTVAAEVTPKPKPPQPNEPPPEPPRPMLSNEVPFAIVPDIVLKIGLSSQRTVRLLAVFVFPPAVRDQQVSLFVGDREVPLGRVPQDSVNRFVIPMAGNDRTDPEDAQDLIINHRSLANIPDADYLIRLRVDGVDNLLFDPAAAEPKFDLPRYRRRIPSGAADP